MKMHKLIIIIVLIVLGLFLPFYSESQERGSLPNVKDELEIAENWLVNDLNEEGYFKYRYDPKKGYSTKNNMIRQLMCSKILAEMSQDDPSLQPLHKKNLDYVFANWYKEKEDLGYIYFGKKSKIGAMAMMLRTLSSSPFFDDYKKEAEKLYNTIVHLQNKNGSFNAWYIEPNYSYDEDYLLTFYSGETLTALVEYYKKTNDKKVLNTTLKSQHFYIEHYVTHLEKNYYPAYVPWHTQSLNQLYKLTQDSKYSDAIFILNDKVLEIQNTTGKPVSGYLGRFFNPEHPEYGTPHSSSDAVYTEGLVYAYEIAKMVNDQYHQQKYLTAINLGVHNLKSLQFNKDNTKRFNKPERLIGAIGYKYQDDRIRIDTTSHAIDAFRKIFNLKCESDANYNPN